MKRILILGSAGMAGHVVKKYLSDTGKYIIGELARTAAPVKFTYSVDVTDIHALDHVLNEFNPEVIINCIGVLNKDAEDNPEKAIFLNSFLPHYLAKKASTLGIRLIHISTDCVFSGSKGNYFDTDEKDGIGFYAQSKALGEVNYGAHLTIRTSIIGPEIKTTGIGLLHWFLRNDAKEIKGYTQAYWGGVTTIQLAIAIEHAIEQPICGLIHLTNGTRISKYDLVNIFKNVFDKDVLIKPDDNYKVDKSLAISLQTNLLGRVPSYEKMVQEMKSWMQDNRDLYSHNYTY
ncbi:dTDP-4-dehydrorhamnose reductase family protein [Aquirufa sp. Wall-65K1]